MSDTPSQVPLVEMLRSVPVDARQSIEIGPTHHRNIPYGRHCHDAANRIAGLETENRLLKAELAQVTADFQKECDHDWERVDASFDHAFGTEVIRYMQCEKCGKQAKRGDIPDDEPDRDDPDYDAPKPLTALENFQRNDEHNQ